MICFGNNRVIKTSRLEILHISFLRKMPDIQSLLIISLELAFN